MLLYGVLLAAVPSGATFAQAVPSTARNTDKARELFIQADKNQDGALNLGEWKALGRRERGFRMIDADKGSKDVHRDQGRDRGVSPARQ